LQITTNSIVGLQPQKELVKCLTVHVSFNQFNALILSCENDRLTCFENVLKRTANLKMQ